MSLSTVDTERKVISQLNANWIWIRDWIDSSEVNTAGRIVNFTRALILSSDCTQAVIHCSADTRYKLFVNGKRICVGPARSSTVLWYYDTVDISKHLRQGHNEIQFQVLRYFARSRAAMPFERTPFPGLTVCGTVATNTDTVDLSSLHEDWSAQIDDTIQFPTGIIDDVFLHISERVTPGQVKHQSVRPVPYNFKTLNGDLLPWRLQARSIPLAEESPVTWRAVCNNEGTISVREWMDCFQQGLSLQLLANSSYKLDLQADFHSTAFIRWSFKAEQATTISLKIVYSEGYELEPRQYPFFRTKANRLDSDNGTIIGPFDLIKLNIPASQNIAYEPFWFRTFRVMRIEIENGTEPVIFESLQATQVNYPLNSRALFENLADSTSKDIWDVSVRTMRNCMFDGYSDCPFYEQLQYCCDSRSVALFHYLLSGDDRLMRQAIVNFAASTTPEGLPQSRFPSYVRQVIAGFPLFWILAVNDHHHYFGDASFSRKFLPQIDSIFHFFDAHLNEQGLVANLPEDVWQYVDWVTDWGATDTHPDKGVPTSGRQINLHSWFSLLYAYVLREVSPLLIHLAPPSIAQEYSSRAEKVITAVKKYCFDGKYFTDSLASIAGPDAYSQHCQVLAILSGAADKETWQPLLRDSFTNTKFSRCSYMMKFYAFRAFSLAGGRLYDDMWENMLAPYKKMLANNLTTWEEDDVRQRSDCHAWGSVPIYEFCIELAGVKNVGVGWSKISFEPRLQLIKGGFNARVAIGSYNTAYVECRDEKGTVKVVTMRLDQGVHVISRLPGRDPQDHGVVTSLMLSYP